MRFQDKTVLITGAARGQGAAEARRFVSEGAKVVLSDVLDEEGRALASKLGDGAIYVHHDVTSDLSWRATFEETERAFGSCDILVNNAGIYRPAKIEDTTEQLMEKMFQVNQMGTLLGMKHAAASMKKSGGGAIINISSIAGLRGFANAIAYGSTKWAVRGMTKVAASELAEFGIRVNSVHPGFISTDMLKENTDEINRIGAESAPLKRHGTPEEVAALIAFLASDESAFITGAEIAIDGGWAI
ncbi:SDR family NAD(P)-dependent oxidoreductase [Paraburkholderia bryophila]|jgi:3alpha(or 20beta)-hydroxysteroid dehydrogenase|uniref:3alpha(Or 20beta)-hydroxysteroid dehydrogenase n=1 Tax=Paraburkholderia bryophila TaxID=420952 RepID=A0A329CDV3_9BURK|nr:glucose 1-dehydrogenase [Paraburkholderia bryophila]RAS33156.1 3alpha(or 20beta)-hydroxysteroid dehydrogenase [Paraburkholderia bryophila]